MRILFVVTLITFCAALAGIGAPVALAKAGSAAPPAKAGHAAVRATDPGAVASAKRALYEASGSGTIEQLVAARARFERLSAAEPKSALLHYWVAVADWRLTPRLMKDKTKAEPYCKDGLAHLEQALRLDPKLADALALKAGLQGLSITFDPPSAMSLGPQMEEEFRRAHALAPQNPRVYLLEGLNTLNKPAFVGGGAGMALPVFQKAQDMFAKESVADSTAPDWGRDDAYLWAGRAATKLKDWPRALELYKKALEANPTNAWVKQQLIPEAEKAIADGGKGKS